MELIGEEGKSELARKKKLTVASKTNIALPSVNLNTEKKLFVENDEKSICYF